MSTRAGSAGQAGVALLAAFRDALGEQAVLTGDVVASRARGHFDVRPLEALALVRPRTTAEVATALRLCSDAGQPVIPVGGLTNLPQSTASGPGDVLLSTELMRAIEAVDPLERTMTVQAGVVLETAQERAAEVGLMLPVDLGARGSCTIGGMIATNAGGNRVLRSGMTRAMVLGLEVVLADGTILSHLSGFMKDNTGYDLKQLFVGSEGTLGVVTRAVLRLLPLPASRQTAMLATDTFEQVLGLLDHLDRALGPRLVAFEALWQSFYRLNSGEFAAARPLLADDHPFYAIVEAEGSEPEADGRAFEAALEEALGRGLLVDAVSGGSPRERSAIWAIREGHEAELRAYGMIGNYDVSLARRSMARYVEEVRVGLAALLPGADLHAYGHVGDGNLHLMIGQRAEFDREAADDLVYRSLARFGGSVSAEHGIGLEKKAYLHLSRSPAEMDLMRALKRTLDPAGILNPGKVFD